MHLQLLCEISMGFCSQILGLFQTSKYCLGKYLDQKNRSRVEILSLSLPPAHASFLHSFSES